MCIYVRTLAAINSSVGERFDEEEKVLKRIPFNT